MDARLFGGLSELMAGWFRYAYLLFFHLHILKRKSMISKSTRTSGLNSEKTKLLCIHEHKERGMYRLDIYATTVIMILRSILNFPSLHITMNKISLETIRIRLQQFNSPVLYSYAHFVVLLILAALNFSHLVLLVIIILQGF